MFTDTGILNPRLYGAMIAELSNFFTQQKEVLILKELKKSSDDHLGCIKMTLLILGYVPSQLVQD